MEADTKAQETIEKIRKPNQWLEHCKGVKLENPDMIHRDILKKAKETYKK